MLPSIKAEELQAIRDLLNSPSWPALKKIAEDQKKVFVNLCLTGRELPAVCFAQGCHAGLSSFIETVEHYGLPQIDKASPEPTPLWGQYPDATRTRGY